MVVMARQMDLAVLADQPPVRPDQDRGIETVGTALLLRALGIAQVEADALERASSNSGAVSGLGI